jgi:hypothetical protein
MSNLFKKYEIQKSDGTPVDPEAQYFVLRLDTDPAARHAALMYASYIGGSDPEFAKELREWVSECQKPNRIFPLLNSDPRRPFS